MSAFSVSDPASVPPVLSVFFVLPVSLELPVLEEALLVDELPQAESVEIPKTAARANAANRLVFFS